MSSAQRKWFTAVTPQSISVFTQGGEEGEYQPPSTASASRIDNIWWVDRVKVAECDQGKGIGRTLVKMLQVSLVENHDPSEGRLVAQVCPGGYDTPPDIQRDFYLSCGFRIVKDSPELTMEWSPCRQDSSRLKAIRPASESQVG